MVDFSNAFAPSHRLPMQTTPAPAAALDREFMSLKEFAAQSGQQPRVLVAEAAAGLLPFARKVRAGGKLTSAGSWVVHLPTLRECFGRGASVEDDVAEEVVATSHRRGISSARQPSRVTKRAAARHPDEARIDYEALFAATVEVCQAQAAGPSRRR